MPSSTTTPAFAQAITLSSARPSLGVPVCRSRGAAAPQAGRSARRRAHLHAQPKMNVIGADENDVLLGELAFTEPDQLPMLVAERVAEGKLGDEFYDFVDGKINASADLEERETLRLLVAAVKQLVEEVSNVRNAGGAGLPGEAGDGGEGAGSVFKTADPAEMANATYDALIKRFVGATKEEDAEKALAANVEVSYEQIDKRFLDRLADMTAKAEADGTEEEAKALAAVNQAIAMAMSNKVQAATEKLKTVISAGSPDNMRLEISRINNIQGGIDDAFILLLQGNIQQAEAAGQEPAVKILKMLLEHASTLKDARLSPEIRLIRKLIRTDDSDTRIDILTESLKPNKGVLLADGTKTEGVRVNGKKFVTALRELIEQYSNVEEAFAMQLSVIGEESEAVARKLFDMEEKDVKDLQNEAFHKRSVSVWDLEQVEMREEVEGRKAPWDGALGNIPEGFDEHGKMAI